MKTKKDGVVLKWVFKVSGPALWWTVLFTVLRILQGASCIYYAYIMGQVINCAQYGLKDDFFKNLWLFIGLVIITLIFQASGRYLAEKSKSILEKSFRVHAFSELLQRDYARISRTHTGEWMNRITSDCNVVTQAVSTIVPEVAGMLVRMLGAFFALVQIVPNISLILIPSTILLGLCSYLLRRKLKNLHGKMQEADGQSRSFMQEQLSSLLVVRAFTQEGATSQKASERMGEYVKARMRRFHAVNFSYTCLSLILNGAQVLGIGICGWSILKGTMSYGTMSSVLYLINLMENPLTNISGYLSQYYSMLASAERLMEIEEYVSDMKAEPLSQEDIHSYYCQEFESVGFTDVSFAYAEDKENVVLDKLSMNIRKGEFVSFTGESGCGKSTAIKLLLSLYPLDSGCIYLRDIKGNEQPLDASWRRLFAYVPQGNQLISGTIREMLTFGDKELMKQEERLRSALEIACANSFVSELPDGLDTVLGERGSGLSEGQMQRLSVARAILSNRPILLLDEATSALDGPTEEQLLKNLRAMTERTVLIITHREAALAVCDKQIHFQNNLG